MNQTLSLPQFAQIVAQKLGVSNSEAQEFITALTAHISETLIVNETVQISGIGTFTRNSNKEEPVTFIPDALLAKHINQAFDIFEPVAIPESAVDIVENKTTIEDDGPENIPEVTTPEPIPNEAPAVHTPVAQDVQTEEMDNNQEQEEQEHEHQQEKEYITQPQEQHRGFVPYLIACSITLAVGLAVGYFLHDIINVTPQENVATPLVAEAETKLYTHQTSITEDDTVFIFETEDVERMPQQNMEAERRAVITDTITPTRFLTTMAREYYGQMEYWAFIYDANRLKLGHPNRIKPGTTVVIPAEDDFTGTDTKDRVLIRAKALGSEIYSQFE